MNNKKAILLLWGFFACFILMGAPKTYKADYSEKYPVLDGKIPGDPAWEKVQWEEGFLLHRKNASPQYPTRFKMLYTKDALYMAVECFEKDPAKLKKVYNFNEFWIYDTVEFFLMPAKNEIMQFIANYESMTYESIPGNVAKRTSFRTGWKAVGRKGDKNWSVEFCIPFYLLGKVPASSDLKITGNICRNSVTTNERSTWSLQMKAFKDPAGFGNILLKKVPAKAKKDLEEALKKPHWLSLAERWKSIRKDPAWEEILEKFPAEKAALEKLIADEKNYPANSGKFYEKLSRIESYASKQEVRERKRIWKRFFEE
ncbi:MAG: hypothetical protein J6S53_01020 [Lentisphaeria bacterium]|nr:hypothetical protein [Lentisphaeria bacterium]